MPTDYEYKTSPMAPVISATSKKGEGAQAAENLQSIIDRQGTDGWEFYRVDSFAVQQPAGCLGAMSGNAKGETTSNYVATFRRRLLPVE